VLQHRPGADECAVLLGFRPPQPSPDERPGALTFPSCQDDRPQMILPLQSGMHVPPSLSFCKTILMSDPGCSLRTGTNRVLPIPPRTGLPSSARKRSEIFRKGDPRKLSNCRAKRRHGANHPQEKEINIFALAECCAPEAEIREILLVGQRELSVEDHAMIRNTPGITRSLSNSVRGAFRLPYAQRPGRW
jgi:hypothetical protein